MTELEVVLVLLAHEYGRPTLAVLILALAMFLVLSYLLRRS